MSWLLVLLLTPSAVFLARWISSRSALLLLVTIAGYFPFVMEAQVSFFSGFLLLLLWTVMLSVLILWFSWREPERMELLIWRSREYTSGMFRWIASGKLPEGSPKNVVFFHIKQTLLYCVIALLSANFLALLLGSALLNYMNYYVARLARSSSNSSRALIMGWNPWSVVRVLSFLWLGMVVSTPSLGLLFAIPWRLSVPLVIPGVAGILVDLAFKLTLSPIWSTRLRAGLSKSSEGGTSAPPKVGTHGERNRAPTEH
jgi:hypothetical protein